MQLPIDTPVRCKLDEENALVHVISEVSCDGQTGVTASVAGVIRHVLLASLQTFEEMLESR